MKPISLDLRERILAAVKSKKYIIADIADMFTVSVSTVKSIKRRYEQTGSVASYKKGGGNPPRVNLEGEAWLAETLKEEPDLTLEELCTKHSEKFSRDVSISAMQRTLARIGLNRKKKLSTQEKRRAKE